MIIWLKKFCAFRMSSGQRCINATVRLLLASSDPDLFRLPMVTFLLGTRLATWSEKLRLRLSVIELGTIIKILHFANFLQDRRDWANGYFCYVIDFTN